MMSEGFLCDRCGSTHGGGPDTMLVIGNGRNRVRRAITSDPQEEYVGMPTIGNVELDYCQSCRNDLRKFHADGGGDPSDIARGETDAE